MPNDEAAPIPPPVVSMRLVSGPTSTATDPGRSSGAAALLRGQFLAPRRPRVLRQCHIRISGLKLIKPLSRRVAYLCISARIRGEKVRSLLVSGPIPAPSGPDSIPLDLWFSLSYMHRLKGPTNVLQIAIHRCKEDGRSSQLQGRVDVPLDYILQKPWLMPTQLQLYSNKACIASVDVMIWTARPASESFEHKGKSIEGTNAANLDEPSSASASSAVSDATELSVDREQSPDLNDDSKNTSNALLRLRPVIYSKMKLVRQSGSKMIDRLKHNLRRRSISSSDDEATNTEDPRDIGNTNLQYPSEIESQPVRSLQPSDDSDLLIANFADIPTQIETVALSFTNDPSSLPNTIIFVDCNSRQSRQLLEWGHRASAKSVLSLQRMVFFNDSHDAELLFFGLTTLYKQIWPSSSVGDQLRIGIAGDDTSITMILRPFVQLMARDPRSWLNLKFYVIPLNPHSPEHEISEKIASSDPQYRFLFRSSAWENVFDGKSILIEPVGRQIEENISHFLLKADTVFRLPIAEAMIEVVDDDPEVNGTAVSVPLIRDFSIIDIDYGPDFQQQHVANALFPALKAPKPLIIEYWAVDKRVGKVSKFTLKNMFSTARVFRLDSLAMKYSVEIQHDDHGPVNAAEADPLSETTIASNSVHQSISSTATPALLDESFHMLIRLHPRDKGKFLQRFGAYSPKKSSGHTSSHYERNEVITKFVCSAPHDVKFTACLDGLVISGCKFASLSPLWPTRTKSFPIAMFKN